jgi:hypothetical protein
METLFGQYKEAILLLFQLGIVTFFLLLGYVLGRNSADRPVVAVRRPRPIIDDQVYDDLSLSPFDEAMLDDEENEKRIATA